MNERDPHTLALTLAAVKATSIAEVARRTDLSRTTISLYVHNKYPADPAAVESVIRINYDSYICPHTEVEISGQDCKRRAQSPKPFGGGRAKVAHWQACQACPYNKGGQHEKV